MLKKLKLTVFLGVIGVVIVFGGTVFSPKMKAGNNAENGAELFKANCARCHGDDAKGDIGPDLTDPQRQAKWKDSDEKIVSKITTGGRRMPGFDGKLKPAEIKEIAKFVRSLNQEVVDK